MCSIKAYSFISQTELPFPTPKFPNHRPCKTLNPLFTNPLPFHKPNSLPFRTTKLYISLNPTSIFRTKTSSVSPKNQFFKSLSEKIVVFLVGSFIFMGCFNARPCLALPAQTTTSSRANLEGEKETQKGKSEEEERYEKVLEKEPGNVEALKVVLYGKMRRGKTKEAVECVEKLIDIEPNEVEWRLLQALCYEMMGQLSKAKRLFKEILEERPLLLRALHGLAVVMHKNHEGPAVFERLNEALEVALREKRVTEERNIRILIAQMHVVKGELEEGLKKFQDLMNDNPRDFRPYLCQGIIYSLLDKKKEAAEQFEIYQSLVPEEFPQRCFLDDVVLAAKTKSHEWLQKEFEAEFSYKKRRAANVT
ncbi:PREDICTED: protein SLOW GREEN 1, chloroplastic [Theobroma cacao]|uniref:Protein SLOW GREEN 1, chloroplastic n=1 Tax=Theobroma cacao TaxID=3641 RepID=A0AB32VPC3_THECC|nr:PREDICTED: protein SLOW GREEN 1, chloroplastic [Theobroma cacao]